ncbi:sensor histidine kinase [Jiangella alkaliphila]|uniref:Signal transduction histidine kinase n=1 Tax=Jiangella alkaliphila TaxID=419479 RepID=A0A1H2LD89_9ACTN|nr:ATP-binding protein [Jiangella alkaliphila]SDU78598.1 Signal transduction histidine kinase [Jiangella alkaliphila]
MSDRPRGLGRALARHAALTAVALVLVSGVTMLGIWRYANDEAHRSAEQVSTEIAETVIVALARYEYAPADDEHRRRVMRTLDPYLDSGLVDRVKIWRLDGEVATIVVSDERRIEGETRPVDHELARRLDAGEAVTYRVPLDDEHRFETSRADELVEVFIGFEDALDRPMRLELYVPVDIGGTVRQVAGSLVPLVLGALLLLAAVTLPLTVALARRMHRDAERRQELLRYGLAASDQERRDLARRLHDGVIQDLAGAGLLLDTVTADEPARPTLQRVRGLIAANVRHLRSMLTELTPAGPLPADAAALMHRLAAELGSEQLPISTDAPPGLTLDDDTATLLFRAVRELLRNAVRHSGATHLGVRVRADDADLTATVTDDGAGFDPAQARAAGHIGLAMVEQALVDDGGSLALESSPAGTRAVVRLPVRGAAWPPSATG